MTLLFWTSSLQNYKTIHVYHFKPPSLWCFVVAALKNKYAGGENSYMF